MTPVFGGCSCAFVIKIKALIAALWARREIVKTSLCGGTEHCPVSVSLSLSLSPSGQVGVLRACGVTIARSNVSRMDPNHEMLSSQHVSPPGQEKISESLSRTWAWFHLRTAGWVTHVLLES